MRKIKSKGVKEQIQEEFYKVLRPNPIFNVYRTMKQAH